MSDDGQHERGDGFEGEDVGDEHAYDDVAALLGGLPTQPMPEDVWLRLATALSAEAGATPIRPVAGRRRTWLPAAVGAGAAGVAAAIAIPLIAVGGANVASGPQETSQALSVEPVTLDVVPARFVVSTGTDYTEPAMSAQVSGLLGEVGLRTTADLTTRAVSAPAVPSAAAGASGEGARDMTRDLHALHDCLAALTGDVDQAPALVVDHATFGGGDAAIVVFLHDRPSAGTATVDVIVVNPACTDADRSAARRMTVEVHDVAP